MFNPSAVLSWFRGHFERENHGEPRVLLTKNGAESMNFAHVANDGSEMSFVIKQQVARTTDWQKKTKSFRALKTSFLPSPSNKGNHFV